MNRVFAYFLLIALVMVVVSMAGKGAIYLLGMASVAFIIAVLLVIAEKVTEIREELRKRNRSERKNESHSSE